jgi:hypothetical protein
LRGAGSYAPHLVHAAAVAVASRTRCELNASRAIDDSPRRRLVAPGRQSGRLKPFEKLSAVAQVRYMSQKPVPR